MCTHMNCKVLPGVAAPDALTPREEKIVKAGGNGEAVARIEAILAKICQDSPIGQATISSRKTAVLTFPQA